MSAKKSGLDAVLDLAKQKWADSKKKGVLQRVRIAIDIEKDGYKAELQLGNADAKEGHVAKTFDTRPKEKSED